MLFKPGVALVMAIVWCPKANTRLLYSTHMNVSILKIPFPANYYSTHTKGIHLLTWQKHGIHKATKVMVHILTSNKAHLYW